MRAYDHGMVNRRGFELIVIVGVLLMPARTTVRTWAKRMLAAHPNGHVLNTVGEVVVSIL
jgi:hypothetical protein